MSTQTTHAPSAPELPTTSHGETSAPPTESMDDWTYFDNTTNDGTEQTATTTTVENVNSTADNAAPKTTTSTTYSFPGSALGSDSTANINSIKTESGSTSGDSKNKNNEEEKIDDSMYECNICLDTAKDAVVSLCGHLFCWPCLHQWLETRPNCKLCPVCKAAIGKDKVIPLYGRNSTKQEDPR